LCPFQKIGLVGASVKFLDLHLDAKSFIEGLDIISNIVGPEICGKKHCCNGLLPIFIFFFFLMQQPSPDVLKKEEIISAKRIKNNSLLSSFMSEFFFKND
jgi:hypothetical protein